MKARKYCEHCEDFNNERKDMKDTIKKKDRVIDSFEDHIRGLNFRIKEL